MRAVVMLAMAVLLVGVIVGGVAGSVTGARRSVAVSVPAEGCSPQLVSEFDEMASPHPVLVCWDGSGTLNLPEPHGATLYR